MFRELGSSGLCLGRRELRFIFRKWGVQVRVKGARKFRFVFRECRVQVCIKGDMVIKNSRKCFKSFSGIKTIIQEIDSFHLNTNIAIIWLPARMH